MTMANSSPPIRPTWPNGPTSLTSRWATLFSTASPLGWPNVSLTGLKPSRSRNMIAQGVSPPAEPDSASPSSWRTRPRLGRPESTSILARLVSRSWVRRTSVTSWPTPRKPWNWPATSMIGSPDRLIQRVPRRVFSSISRLAKGWRDEQGAAERAVAAQRGGQRMADQLVGRAAEQGGHPRGDVDDPVLGIDLPQPADAAMLIFVEQQADRFAPGRGPWRAPAAGRRSSGSAAATLNAPAPATQHEGERRSWDRACRRRNNRRGRRRAVRVAIQAIAAAGIAASAIAAVIIAAIAPPITTWTCGGWVAKA